MITSTLSIKELIVFLFFGLPIMIIFIVLIYSFFESTYNYLFKEKPKVSMKNIKPKEELTSWKVINIILLWIIILFVLGFLCNKPNNSRYYEPTRF
jgi:hypothetical protein